MYDLCGYDKTPNITAIYGYDIGCEFDNSLLVRLYGGKTGGVPLLPKCSYIK